MKENCKGTLCGVKLAQDNLEVKLSELDAAIEEQVKLWNAALSEKKIEALGPIGDNISSLVSEYAATARDLCFDQCKATGDPMMAAVKTMAYTVLTTVSDPKTSAMRIVVRERTIDLLKLDKYCGGIGVDKNWKYIAEKMNCLLTFKTAIDIGSRQEISEDCYHMSKIAKQIDLGETPTSNTSCLKSLQTLVAAMIGENYKPISHDVKYMLNSYTKMGKKALTLVVPSNKKFAEIMLNVCNHIVDGTPYGLKSKYIKKS